MLALVNLLLIVNALVLNWGTVSLSQVKKWRFYNSVYQQLTTLSSKFTLFSLVSITTTDFISSRFFPPHAWVLSFFGTRLQGWFQSEVSSHTLLLVLCRVFQTVCSVAPLTEGRFPVSLKQGNLAPSFALFLTTNRPNYVYYHSNKKNKWYDTLDTSKPIINR